MNNGNISKKATETIQNKINSKSKVTPSIITTKPNSGISANNNAKKKEEDSLIFKDKSPIMFNRSKNNFYQNDLGKSNYGKFNFTNSNKNNNTKEPNKLEFINNPIGKITSNNIILNKNVNVKSLSNSLKSPNNSSTNATNLNFDNNNNEIKSQNLFKKNFISQQNVLLSNDKVNNLITVNPDNQLNEALKRELDSLRAELSLANLVKNLFRLIK